MREILSFPKGILTIAEYSISFRVENSYIGGIFTNCFFFLIYRESNFFNHFWSKLSLFAVKKNKNKTVLWDAIPFLGVTLKQE